MIGVYYTIQVVLEEIFQLTLTLLIDFLLLNVKASCLLQKLVVTDLWYEDDHRNLLYSICIAICLHNFMCLTSN